MAVAKAKPGSVANTISGDLGDTGGDFAMHVMDGDFDFFSPLLNTTGDSDSTPIWENNQLVEGRFNLRGAMVAGTALVLANLIDTANKNPVTNFAFTFHSGRVLTVTIIVEHIRIRWNKNAQIVGVALSGRMTDTAAESGDI